MKMGLMKISENKDISHEKAQIKKEDKSDDNEARQKEEA